MRRIALVGLTADPITLGHEGIAATVANSGLVDEVWIQPCWKHRFEKKTVAAERRLAMCQLVCDQLQSDQFKVSDFEIRHRIDGGTYETLKRMREEFPDAEFLPVIGMDNAIAIEKWAQWEKLIEEVAFIVLARAGITGTHTWFMSPPHTYLTDWVMEVSSTAVREMLGENKDALPFLNPVVLQYIKKHELYTRES